MTEGNEACSRLILSTATVRDIVLFIRKSQRLPKGYDDDDDDDDDVVVVAIAKFTVHKITITMTFCFQGMADGPIFGAL